MPAHKQAHSLRAKLQSLAVGDVVFFADATPADGKASSLERQIKTAQPRLGMRFTTGRCDVVTAQHQLEHALRVERVE